MIRRLRQIVGYYIGRPRPSNTQGGARLAPVLAFKATTDILTASLPPGSDTPTGWHVSLDDGHNLIIWRPIVDDDDFALPAGAIAGAIIPADR